IYPGTQLFERATSEGRILPGSDLLRPTYYFSPDLMQHEIFEQLRQFSSCSPNWIAGDPNASYEAAITRLRQRGVVGPLWSYLAMIQRIAPMELALSEPSSGPTGRSTPAQAEAQPMPWVTAQRCPAPGTGARAFSVLKRDSKSREEQFLLFIDVY